MLTSFNAADVTCVFSSNFSLFFRSSSLSHTHSSHTNREEERDQDGVEVAGRAGAADRTNHLERREREAESGRRGAVGVFGAEIREWRAATGYDTQHWDIGTHRLRLGMEGCDIR